MSGGKRLEILHVISTFEPGNGGPYVAVKNMCKTLANRGHTVSVFTTDLEGYGGLNPFGRNLKRLNRPRGQPVREDGYQVSYYRAEWPTRWCYSRDLWWALARHAQDYDLVHIHGAYVFPVLSAAWHCRDAHVPYVMRPHGALAPFLRQRNRWPKWAYDLWQHRDFDRAAAIHFTSHGEMDQVRSLGFRAPGHVVPLGIDTSRFTSLPERGEFRARFLNGWDGYLFLYLGRINFKKGLDLLIEAFRRLVGSSHARLAIVGGDSPQEYGDHVRSIVAEGGMSEQVIFTGPLYDLDKLTALADADAFVLPSYTENFGVALVEAMACGLPVIVSDQVDISGEIREAEAGLIVKCEVSDLVAGMERLMACADNSARYGANGLRLVRENFSLDGMGDRLEDMYRQIVLGAPK